MVHGERGRKGTIPRRLVQIVCACLTRESVEVVNRTSEGGWEDNGSRESGNEDGACDGTGTGRQRRCWSRTA